MGIHGFFMGNEKRKSALGKSDSTGGYGPYFAKYFAKMIFVKFEGFSSKLSTCKKAMNPYGFWMTFGTKSQNGENEKKH